FAKGPIRGDAQTAVGNQGSTRRNSRHFDRIDGRRSGIFSGKEFSSARKDLERTDQIEDLDPRPANQNDPTPPARWTLIPRLLTFNLSSIGEERKKIVSDHNVDSSLVTHHLSLFTVRASFLR